MIVITGAAGFIGSAMVSKLNSENFNDLVLVDDFSNETKNKNLNNKEFSLKIHRDIFPEWLKLNHKFVEFIFHIGARTDTTEFNYQIFEKLNVNYTKTLWQLSVEYGLPIVYASSAATYGGGELGYKDDETIIPQLKPLNPYGISKNEFDKWALTQQQKPYFWTGLKFFNVYGPNEYHKKRMASVIFHSYHQIKETGKIKLFKSHREGIGNGEQKRDFVYVKDVCDVMYFFMHHRKNSGIYNLGTGEARTFNDLAKATFNAMNIPQNIEYIDTPEDIRDKYQYFTQADMTKLKSIGYSKPFTSLEQGVSDYVSNYLMKDLYY
ncbi:MAG TPA: ADP-glyceromanno-heptose 6-epimerase [Bacteroidales bacterium]|jgi:ADP-L-glycero-D-manno-heptose 6-epimerase|nr:ADP-glyceromanno-heptose 6-epimerase [Bacteroidales bacterium]